MTDLIVMDHGVPRIAAAPFFRFLDTDAEAVGLYTYLVVEQGYVENSKGVCIFSPAVALSITRRLIAAGRARPAADGELIGQLQRAGVLIAPDVSGDSVASNTLN